MTAKIFLLALLVALAEGQLGKKMDKAVENTRGIDVLKAEFFDSYAHVPKTRWSADGKLSGIDEFVMPPEAAVWQFQGNWII